MTAQDERHRQRMARKKAHVDAGIAAAQQERGVVIVNTGNGKGKSSAGFGLLARALGHGQKVAVVQFIKGRDSTGEERFFRGLGVEFHVMGEGFTWETASRARDEAAARSGWAQALRLLHDPAIDLLLLDELNIVLKYHYLPIDEVVAALAQRPTMQSVVITGRGAPAELIAAADTVSEMGEVKHAYKAGVKARAGVEF